jgi:hypothetical protein
MMNIRKHDYETNKVIMTKRNKDKVDKDEC